jgi:hypothetical protein
MTTNTSENEQGLRQIMDMTRAISIVILLLHFYFYCYAAFRDWQLTFPIVDRIFYNIQRTGLFSSFMKTKLIVIGFLLLSLIGSGGRKTQQLTYREPLTYLIIGISVYLGSQLIFLFSSLTATTLATAYMIVTVCGYVLLLTGGALLSRVIQNGLSDEVFNDEFETFPQEERLLCNDYSINLPIRYRHRGERRSWINIVNGRRGVLIAGSPGAGKSWFIVEPTLRTLSEKQDVSISESRQLDPSVPASTISNLSSGEFVGIVADDPALPIDLKAFHGRIINDPDAAARERRSLVPLPKVRTVDESTIRATYQQVPKDVRDIYDDVMEMLRNDSDKLHLIVSKSGG